MYLGYIKGAKNNPELDYRGSGLTRFHCTNIAMTYFHLNLTQRIWFKHQS